KIIDGQTVISFISNFTGKDLSPVFEQYTKHAELPVFEYTTYRKGKKSILKYKWNSPVPDFHMPLEVLINGKTMRLEVQSGNFNTITLENKVKTIEVNKEKFLVEVRKG